MPRKAVSPTSKRTDAHAHPVELAFLGLDTYKATPRSSADENAEDDFARKLRLIGGKWWHCYGDFQNAKMTTRRRLYPDEAEVLFLGWPKKGGVWVLRFEKSKKMKGFEGLRLINGASTMEERCKAIEMAGGSFFERPEDSEFVRPYVEGLGEREERKEIESYLEGGYEGY